MWDTFCIQTYCFVAIHVDCIVTLYFDQQKAYIINIMYTVCVKHSYKMYIQIIVCRMASVILTYVIPFVVHFLIHHCKQLRLETCWLFAGGTYQIYQGA